MWLLGCCSAGVALWSIVWKDLTQQEQYGYPVPEAVCGEICPLIHISHSFFFSCDKTNGFAEFKCYWELLSVLRKVLD